MLIDFRKRFVIQVKVPEKLRSNGYEIPGFTVRTCFFAYNLYRLGILVCPPPKSLFRPNRPFRVDLELLAVKPFNRLGAYPVC
jgi:hypothetical protein